MAKVTRHQNFKLEGGEGTEIRLKKWSAGKLFLIVREFWGLLEKSLDGVDLRQLDEVRLVRQLVATFIESDEMAAGLIGRSIDQPAGLKPEDILEWDADDFICVLTMIIQMNIHEELVKNFRSLLESFALAKAKKEAKKTTTGSPPKKSKKETVPEREPEPEEASPVGSTA